MLLSQIPNNPKTLEISKQILYNRNPQKPDSYCAHTHCSKPKCRQTLNYIESTKKKWKRHSPAFSVWLREYRCRVGTKIGKSMSPSSSPSSFWVQSQVKWGTKFESVEGHGTVICGLDDVGGNLGMKTVLNVTVRCTWHDFRLKWRACGRKVHGGTQIQLQRGHLPKSKHWTSNCQWVDISGG
jgi:hypothetical protein